MSDTKNELSLIGSMQEVPDTPRMAIYKALKSYKSGFLEELLCVIVKLCAPFETPLTIIPLKGA